MIYAMAKIDFMGNDDVNFCGFVIKQVPSVQDWENDMRELLENDFEEDRYITIYHSDNDGTPFDSVDEVMNVIKICEIDKNTFDILMKTLGHQYGLLARCMMGY